MASTVIQPTITREAIAPAVIFAFSFGVVGRSMVCRDSFVLSWCLCWSAQPTIAALANERTLLAELCSPSENHGSMKEAGNAGGLSLSENGVGERCH
jgi:hypothetical protein